ncbi:hypothetical protein YB2330_004401 [Saitoella coloradoensis]
MASVHTRHRGNIVYLSMSELRRPIPPVLDMDKVMSMIETLKREQAKEDAAAAEGKEGEPTELPPVDVLHVRKDGENYYFAFGGCHRLRAHDMSGIEKVRCKLVPCTPKMLKMYMGGSSPFKDDD